VNKLRFTLLLLPLLALAATSACRPFAAEGESCEETPCAYGLSCFEGICVVPSLPDAGPAPCETVEQCGIGGNDDGRACVDGECVWLGCSSDVECGTRVCDRGECRQRETCVSDDECERGEVCENDACRSACADDGDCGGGLAVCASDGQCRQQCFIDLMCFGDLCVNGVCEPPECANDGDCSRPDGTFFCNAGRCESYLPCGDDDDCFDANFLCNEAGRCEERPLCSVDAECGLDGICVDVHCRPTTPCDASADCDDGDECVAGRCVAEAGCRTTADCSGDQVCSGAQCRDPISTLAESLVMGTAYGRCDADGTGACDIVLLTGEVATVRVTGVAADGAPAQPGLSITGPAGVTVASNAAGLVTLTATSAGSGALNVEVTGTTVKHEGLTVTVVTAPPQTDLAVLVVDGVTGAAVDGATVRFSGDQATTGANGLANLGVPATFDGLLTVEHGQAGVALAGIDAVHSLRVPLVHPPTGMVEPTASGFTARILSSGDEVGDVGIGLAFPSMSSPRAASFGAMFGETVIGSVEVPILGGFPIELPAAATYEATLPIQGNSVVRELAYATTTGGPISATLFEGRQEQGGVFGLLGGGDAVGTALDFAAAAEGFDVLWQTVGVVDDFPLVADGAADYDGDGDTTELVPDWQQLPAIEATPTQLATERVGVSLSGLPPGARARAFAFAGHWLAGWGFAPTGIGVAELTGEDARVQLKAHGPRNDALATAPAVVVIEALYQDTRTSRARVQAAAFSNDLDAGQLLAPPVDAFFVDGIPAPGERTLFLPATAGTDATTFRVRLVGGTSAWDLVVSAGGGGGRTVAIPAELGGLTSFLVEVSSMRLTGMDAEAATLAPFLTGAGPTWPLDESAEAIATASSF
jgi:hypothetical protein